MRELDLFDKLSDPTLQTSTKSGRVVSAVFLMFAVTLVMAQVAALQAASVVPFLRAFSQHIERFPSALRDALPWIEALITARRGDISASPECRRRVAELQNTLRQRTQQIGIFSEASALSNSVKREKEGSGIGLEVVDTFCQDFVEENL